MSNTYEPGRAWESHRDHLQAQVADELIGPDGGTLADYTMLRDDELREHLCRAVESGRDELAALREVLLRA